eukprot:GEMP01024888.1.p1 GENE.GEMP01024888.1~~GEMP01024888.1.p1  ORF type:complete len:225 (+),score=56.23 GEMP01024888.1:211-885(+)
MPRRNQIAGAVAEAKMAAGLTVFHDPTQLSEEWKRRCWAEEQALLCIIHQNLGSEEGAESRSLHSPSRLSNRSSRITDRETPVSECDTTASGLSKIRVELEQERKRRKEVEDEVVHLRTLLETANGSPSHEKGSTLNGHRAMDKRPMSARCNLLSSNEENRRYYRQKHAVLAAKFASASPKKLGRFTPEKLDRFLTNCRPANQDASRNRDALVDECPFARDDDT